MVIFHKPLILLGLCKVEETALAPARAAETSCRAELFLTLREGAVIEAEFFTVLNMLLGEHSNRVGAVVLAHLCYRLAIRVATVRKARGEVSKQYGVNSEHVVAVRVVEVTLVRDVVKIRQVLRELPSSLALFENVLLLVP